MGQHGTRSASGGCGMSEINKHQGYIHVPGKSSQLTDAGLGYYTLTIDNRISNRNSGQRSLVQRHRPSAPHTISYDLLAREQMRHLMLTMDMGDKWTWEDG